MDEFKLAHHFLGAVTVGERGQVVVPAGAREACGISPGDKLLVFLTPDGGGVAFVRLDKLQQCAKMLEALLESTESIAPPDEADE